MRAIDKGNGARRQLHGMIGMKQSWSGSSVDIARMALYHAGSEQTSRLPTASTMNSTAVFPALR
jgi:hypothetical protein